MNILDQIKSDKNFSVDRSVTWFQSKLKSLNLKAGDPRLLNDPRFKIANVPRVGSFYLYLYDPKYKDTLPFYDIFPITLITDIDKSGFSGFNFHYLAPKVRGKLYDNLIKYAPDESFQSTLASKQRLQVSAALKSSANSNLMAPAFKRYLFPHVKSQFRLVPLAELKLALMLPTEGFHGSSALEVWKHSAQQKPKR